jgi:hypothetical protein
MTDKEKLAREYIELTAKFFEDSENVIFIKDIGKDYEFFMKGEGGKVLDMALEICESVIDKTEIPIDIFMRLLEIKMKQRSEGVTLAEIFDMTGKEGEDAKEKSDPLH